MVKDMGSKIIAHMYDSHKSLFKYFVLKTSLTVILNIQLLSSLDILPCYRILGY